MAGSVARRRLVAPGARAKLAPRASAQAASGQMQGRALAGAERRAPVGPGEGPGVATADRPREAERAARRWAAVTVPLSAA